ncbi:2284_t:CDS:2, partial [Racocetra persica]
FSSDYIPARDECDYCGTLLNLPSLNPIDDKDLVEGNYKSKRRKKSKNAETENLSLEDNILAQLEKDKSALNRVDEACKIAIDRFLN